MAGRARGASAGNDDGRSPGGCARRTGGGVGTVSRRAATRGSLVAVGAFAVGVWLGVSAGLATRAKRGQAR